MDRYLIFDTEQEAQDALDIINQIASSWWASQGYTVINGELVGKNASTGLDEPEKARTTTWANIVPVQDGYGFYSLSNDARFVDWRDYLPDGVTFPDDIEYTPPMIDSV